MEKDINEKFSVRWEIYRVATHPLGGLHLVAEMDSKYSTKNLYDMMEVIDVYDALERAALAKAADTNKKN